MQKYKISEFSKLTNVSVRTLHHYDQIGLLSPLKNQENGFRVYRETELLKLANILSLKFLGFKLLTIKGLLDHTIPVQAEFLAQQKVLGGKIDSLLSAQKILEQLTTISKSSPLKLILKLVELYREPYQLKNLKKQKRIENLLKLCTELLEETKNQMPIVTE